MDWIWFAAGAFIAFSAFLIFLVIRHGQRHHVTLRDDEDQMEAIRQYNEKRAQREAKKQARKQK